MIKIMDVYKVQRKEENIAKKKHRNAFPRVMTLVNDHYKHMR